MNLRRHKVPESPQTIRRRSSLLTCDELLLKFPIDLVIEIFSRLPLKSIALCRCVSKRWSSVLRRPDFTDVFFTRSSTRHKLLFACRKEDKKEVINFSTPQPQNLGENVSLIADLHALSFVCFQFLIELHKTFQSSNLFAYVQIIDPSVVHWFIRILSPYKTSTQRIHNHTSLNTVFLNKQ